MGIVLNLGLTWVVCGLLATGFEFAFFQHAFPTIAKISYKKDRMEAYVFGLAGPIALLTILTDLRRIRGIWEYGIKFW